MDRKVKSPPTLARLLLRFFLSGESSEIIVGDLHEEYADMVGKWGGRHARRWFWRHAIESVLARWMPAGFERRSWGFRFRHPASWERKATGEGLR